MFHPASIQYASALFFLHIDQFEMLWEKNPISYTSAMM
jgi:hypothetical protein